MEETCRQQRSVLNCVCVLYYTYKFPLLSLLALYHSSLMSVDRTKLFVSFVRAAGVAQNRTT